MASGQRAWRGGQPRVGPARHSRFVNAAMARRIGAARVLRAAGKRRGVIVQKRGDSSPRIPLLPGLSGACAAVGSSAEAGSGGGCARAGQGPPLRWSGGETSPQCRSATSLARQAALRLSARRLRASLGERSERLTFRIPRSAGRSEPKASGPLVGSD